jgi:hypothetical protein
MKTGSIASNLVALSLGALLTACGGAEMNDGSQLSSDSDMSADDVASYFDQAEQEVTSCDDAQYDHWRYLAALAVASANELGRWNAAKDFVKENTNNSPRILLSSEGLARCNPSGCPNVSAILQMQNMETAVTARHDPLLLRQYMVTYFTRQVNNGGVSPAHTLTYLKSEDDICGMRYYYTVGGGTTTSTTGISGTSELKATSAYKCLDIIGVSGNDGAQVQQYSCNGTGTNQKFSIEAVGSNYRLKANNSGKCLGVTNNASNDGALLEQRTCGSNNSQLFSLNSKGNGSFELKNVQSGKCVDMQSGGTADGQKAQIYACHGGANQTFQAPGFTSGSTTTTSSVTPSSLWSQLKFAGELDNKYLMFKSDATTVSIDPMGTMTPGGAGTSSGSCFTAPPVYSATDNLTGSCCMVSAASGSTPAKYGSLYVSPYNAKVYLCK